VVRGKDTYDEEKKRKGDLAMATRGPSTSWRVCEGTGGLVERGKKTELRAADWKRSILKKKAVFVRGQKRGARRGGYDPRVERPSAIPCTE